MRHALGLVILVGCSNHTGNGIDAAAVLVDAPAPPPGHHHYVIDRATLPETNTQARDSALDLDGDGAVDNQLGMVFSTFAGMGFHLGAAMTNEIDTGKVIMLADLYAPDLASAPDATFALYQGSDPMPAACASTSDTTCRRHLAGTGTFSIKASTADPPIAAPLLVGLFAGGPGHVTIQLGFGGTPAVVTLVGAHVRLQMPAETGFSDAILAGGVVQADVDGKLVPSFRDGFMVRVKQDCTMLSSPPGCGCVAETGGKTFIGLYDADHNCDISVEEVRKNPLTMSLLAPDVMVEGMPALSLGVKVSAVRGGFVAPQ